MAWIRTISGHETEGQFSDFFAGLRQNPRLDPALDVITGFSQRPEMAAAVTGFSSAAMAFDRRSLRPRQRRGWRRALRGFIAVAPLIAGMITLGGCWPFNRTPPQQEYFNALKIGNSAQASQLWLQMTPEQRAKFERGEDIRPSVSHNDVQQAIDEHYSEQQDDSSTPKHIELTPDLGGGLQNLPSYLNANGAGGVAQPAPPEQ